MGHGSSLLRDLWDTAVAYSTVAVVNSEISDMHMCVSVCGDQSSFYHVDLREQTQVAKLTASACIS